MSDRLQGSLDADSKVLAQTNVCCYMFEHYARESLAGYGTSA